MDVNGARFHLFLGEDWFAARDCAGRPPARREGEPGELWLAPGSPPALQLHPRAIPLRARPADAPLTLADRRGAAMDRHQNVYRVGEGGDTLQVQDRHGVERVFWSPELGRCADPPGTFRPLTPVLHARPQLRGVAVTTADYLVVGVARGSGPGRLLIFDLVGGGAPSEFQPAPLDPWDPWDLAADLDGGVVVLDRTARRVWALDRLYRPRPPAVLVLANDTLQPAAPGPVRQHTVGAAANLQLDGDPVAVDVLSDGSLVVLDRANHTIQRVGLGAGAPAWAPYPLARIPLGELDDGTPAPAIRGHDLLVEGEQVYLVDAGNNQAFVLDVLPGTDYGPRATGYGQTPSCQVRGPIPGAPGPSNRRNDGGDAAGPPSPGNTAPGSNTSGNTAPGSNTSGNTAEPERAWLDARAALFPLRHYRGEDLVAGAGRGWYRTRLPGGGADAGRWIKLTEERRHAYREAATLSLPAFDAGSRDTTWHRLVVEAGMPAGSAVDVESRVGNSDDELEAAPWAAEPALVQRRDGSEIPWADLKMADGCRATCWELLLQQRVGRLLQIRLTLRSNLRSTPKLLALRVWYPRFSYLDRYLPGAWRADPASASFTERWLANFEGFYSTIEGRIAGAQVLFDARAAPAEALDWLAGWFGMSLDPNLTERQRRLLVAGAMWFYAWRGTTRGLRASLRVLLGPESELPGLERGPPDLDRFADGASATQILVREAFLTRPRVGRAPPRPEGPADIRPGPRWYAEDGGAALLVRWNQTRTAAAPPLPPADSFPVVPTAAERGLWEHFCAAQLGFLPSTAPEHTTRWRAFLGRRFSSDLHFQGAFATATSRAAATLPTVLPPDGAALEAWHTFQAVILPTVAAAHRFVVSLPAGCPGASAEAQAGRLELARRIIEIQKPAHTVYALLVHDGMFRVGVSALGADTVLARSSRISQGAPGLVLGDHALGAAALATAPPADRLDRVVLGRDRIPRSTTFRTETTT